MAERRHLRSIDPEEGLDGGPAGPPARGRRRPWLTLILAAALAATLFLFASNRAEFRRRLEALQTENLALRAEVERRDQVIEAQRSRLGDVRTRVDDVRTRLEDLRTLLQEPLPAAD